MVKNLMIACVSSVIGMGLTTSVALAGVPDGGTTNLNYNHEKGLLRITCELNGKKHDGAVCSLKVGLLSNDAISNQATLANLKNSDDLEIKKDKNKARVRITNLPGIANGDEDEDGVEDLISLVAQCRCKYEKKGKSSKKVLLDNMSPGTANVNCGKGLDAVGKSKFIKILKSEFNS